MKILKFIVIGILAVNTAFAQDKPNIVLILIDDLGWKDVSYMGSKYYETPNIDKLAKSGMIFTNAYANAANCAPSRACLLTGQYTPRHGVFTVGSSERGSSKDRRLIPQENSTSISLDKVTIAEALKTEGYVSAALGKWHVGHTPQEQGFNVGIERDEMGFKGHFNLETGEYLTDRLSDEAVKFIDENSDKPFFLYLTHHAVHTPIQAKDEITRKYESKPGVGCHNKAEYAAMIESVDQSVGKVYSSLKEHHLDQNTLFLFFSDNGGYGPATCMQPLRGGKGMYYEGGIREPMFIHWPEKVKPGSVCDVPVISTDFYPTFLEIAGIKPDKNASLDGVSIMPLLENREFDREANLYWHFPGYLQSYNALTDQSRDKIFRSRPVSVIRKGDWKLLMFHEEWVLDGGRDKIESNNSIELYHLKTDLGETENLSNIEIEMRNILLEELLNWLAKTDAPIPENANPEYVAK